MAPACELRLSPLLNPAEWSLKHSDGCGSAWGFQNFEFTRGQLRLTNSYNLCLAPESLKNGADIIGYACKDGEYNSWRPGQKRGTIAWKGWCLDNAYGLAEGTSPLLRRHGADVAEGNRVQLWRCSSYANKNQVWNLTPAPDLGFPER